MSIKKATAEFWKMTTGKVMDGVFAINKPTGLTSAQVVRDVVRNFTPSSVFAPMIGLEKSFREKEKPNQRGRRKMKEVKVKVGHGGTLDPLATGVLIIGVGKGTKSLNDFLHCTKVYEAVVLFGTDTDTYDRVGKVLKRGPYEHITKELVEKALGQFRGKFMQLPPLYSALKMNGKPLYEYAREGKEIPKEIERRQVEVLDLELVEWMEGGTHSHQAPTDEAGHAEVNIASQVWKQEGVAPASLENEIGEKKSTADTEGNSKDVREEVIDVKTESASEETGKIIDEKSATEAQAVQAEEIKNDTNTKASEDLVAEENFEDKKRKLDEAQDDLVQEQPASKKHPKSRSVFSSQDATMSGGLAPLSESPISKSSIEVSQVKGPPAAKLRMTVTSGFYVRSLCHDLGAAVGSAALMAELIRTRQGEYELGKNCLEHADLEQGEDVWGPKVEAMLDDWYEAHKTKEE